MVAESPTGALIGVAGLERYAGAALLRSVAVAAPGQGVGGALVERLLADGDAAGQDVYLLTTTAERYFPRFGFAPVPRAEVPAALHASVEFCSACPASATVMCRPAPGAASRCNAHCQIVASATEPYRRPSRRAVPEWEGWSRGGTTKGGFRPGLLPALPITSPFACCKGVHDRLIRRSSVFPGVYFDREGADRAYQAIRERGYDDKDVNVLMSDDTRSRYYGDNPADDTAGSKALEGAGAGAGIGGTLGGIIGAIVGVGSNVILPGIGLIAGPLAGALAGAGAGGAAGSVVGALVGAGIPEERAKAYEKHVNDGGIVVGVNPRHDDDASYFEDTFRTGGGQDVARY